MEGEEKGKAMYPEDEKQVVDAAAEHIEDAAIADGLENGAKPRPHQDDADSTGEPWTGSEEDRLEAAEAHIEGASIADGRVD